MSQEKPQNDMDFLLEFREFKGIVMTKLDRAIGDISELKNNLVGRVEALEKNHVSREEFDLLLNWRYYIAGGLAVVIAILTFFVIPSYNDIQSRIRAIETQTK